RDETAAGDVAASREVHDLLRVAAHEPRERLPPGQPAADRVLHDAPALEERLEDPLEGQLALGGLHLEEDPIQRLAGLCREIEQVREGIESAHGHLNSRLETRARDFSS